MGFFLYLHFFQANYAIKLLYCIKKYIFCAMYLHNCKKVVPLRKISNEA